MAKHVIPLPNGFRYKSYFLPYVQPTTHFSINNLDGITSLLIQECCVDSHINFLTKCTHPLWKNPNFFITLPLKRNEDINPTKASHIEMSPEHPYLATKELNKLQTKDLIEPTTSQWTCEAFYVNKRSEQVSGKMRLMIDYELLNHFFTNDKFLFQTKRLYLLAYLKHRYF